MTAADSLRDARLVIEWFYAWYVPIANAEDGLRRVLAERSDVLLDSLYTELKADADAQANATEVVGFDADPFLLSQDPCSRYRVGTAERDGQVFRVRVDCDDGNQYQHGVIAEVASIGGAWKIVNIRDLDGRQDLRSALRRLARDRRR